VRCTSIQSALQETEYKAVSYTRATESGDPSRSQLVYIDDKVLCVTKNCEVALRRLRFRNALRTPWIDTICVNQSNVVERNHQVGLMDQIYQRAARVHICIEQTLEHVKGCIQWLKLGPDKCITATSGPRNKLERNSKARYFDLVWVLQEVAPARALTLHVNGDDLPMTKGASLQLFDLCKETSYCSPDTILPSPLAALLDGQQTRCTTKQLSISMKLSCSDARDQVYGILSLIPAGSRLLMPVDYSLELEQVIANAVLACIVATQSLDILLQTNLRGTTTVRDETNSNPASPPCSQSVSSQSTSKGTGRHQGPQRLTRIHCCLRANFTSER